MAARGINIDRVSVKVSPDQISWLNQVAKAHATSVSDVIRRLIDETMGAYVSRGSPSKDPLPGAADRGGPFSQHSARPDDASHASGFTSD